MSQDTECGSCASNAFTIECNLRDVIITIVGAVCGPLLIFFLRRAYHYCSWRRHRVRACPSVREQY